MHLDEERLQRLLHDELAGEDEAEARAHLAGCDGCRARLTETVREEEEVAGLLDLLDPVHGGTERETEPSVLRARAEALAARAGYPAGVAPPAAEASPLPRSAPAPGAGRPSRRGRWAAALLLASAVGGAAWAAPGTPLPGWLESVATRLGAGEAPSPGDRGSSDPAPDTGPATPAAAGGIAVDPGASLVVSFRALSPGSEAVVTLGDAATVVVEDVAGGAAFRTEPDRLVVDNRAAGDFRVRIPRTARRVVIEVAGRAALTVEEGAVRAGPEVSGDGGGGAGRPYRLPLGPPRP